MTTLTAQDYKAERDNALVLLAEAGELIQQLSVEHSNAIAALEEMRDALEEMRANRAAQQEAGAAALAEAFPTLFDDFTEKWFVKAAGIVLDAAEMVK